MENYYWPGEYGSWGNSQGETAAAAALQYHMYHPAAAGTPWGPPYGGSAGSSRSHSEAEKRRRDRINAQLATLRKLIPESEKMDKAALLGHVVEHVREQGKIAKEVSKSSTVPAETDEITIEQLNDDVQTSSSMDGRSIYFRASICCDDRPKLFAEIDGAVTGLGLTIHKADITTIGGRMKSNLVLCTNYSDDSNNNNNSNNSAVTDSIKQSLKLALSRVVISAGSSGYSARSKRQRFFYPNYH
ncbi:basic helix-loop-helix (bHLH) DNA-bindingsuperfamily protein [Striga asiatica]|uniref:Basic helix-loop-helix (BHLH) DNA-bindingsuperfamily protein n=1 Tax=Striga asiatica TaxID=4170 RepID=A0A5A7R0S9_STRAF|nr:basic helix-loop-helix (bHLH) DNA-bindingsuperfamily protein [Striga asiatica]